MDSHLLSSNSELPTMAISRTQFIKLLSATREGADREALAWPASTDERTILHWRWGKSRRKRWQLRSLPASTGPAKRTLQMQRWLGLELHLPKSYLRIIASHPSQHDRYCPSGKFQETFPPHFFFKPEDESYTSLGETLQLNEANKVQKRRSMHYLASSQHCYMVIFFNLFVGFFFS